MDWSSTYYLATYTLEHFHHILRFFSASSINQLLTMPKVHTVSPSLMISADITKIFPFLVRRADIIRGILKVLIFFFRLKGLFFQLLFSYTLKLSTSKQNPILPSYLYLANNNADLGADIFFFFGQKSGVRTLLEGEYY